MTDKSNFDAASAYERESWSEEAEAFSKGVSRLPSIGLRVATAVDLPFLDSLRRTTLTPIVTNHHAWDDAVQSARVRAHFESARIIMLNGETIGLWKTYREGDHIHLSQVQILPVHQGRGIASHLISKLQSEARQLGLPINLHVYRSNAAIRLYRRHGFEVTEETKDMFTMTWHSGKK